MDTSVFKNLSFEALERAYNKILKFSPVCQETSDTLKEISRFMAEKSKTR